MIVCSSEPMRAIGSAVGRELIRGVLGSLLGGSRRRWSAGVRAAWDGPAQRGAARAGVQVACHRDGHSVLHQAVEREMETVQRIESEKMKPSFRLTNAVLSFSTAAIAEDAPENSPASRRLARAPPRSRCPRRHFPRRHWGGLKTGWRSSSQESSVTTTCVSSRRLAFKLTAGERRQRGLGSAPAALDKARDKNRRRTGLVGVAPHEAASSSSAVGTE